VGHETDHCIADYVADVRAPTPSAAAEIVIAEKAHQLQHLGQIKQRIQQTLQRLIRHDRRRLDGIKRQPIFQSPYGLLGPWMQKLDDLRQDIDQAMVQRIANQKAKLESRHKVLFSLKPTTKIGHFRHRLLHFDRSISTVLSGKIQQSKKRIAQIDTGLYQIWQRQMHNKKRLLSAEQRRRNLDLVMVRHLHLHKERLDKISAALHSIDPKNLLSKGYAILFAEKDRSVITSIRTVEKDMDVRLLLSDGEILSTVKEIIESEQKPEPTRT